MRSTSYSAARSPARRAARALLDVESSSGLVDLRHFLRSVADSNGEHPKTIKIASAT